MKVALYIGNHKGDTLSVRLGWWITRLMQKGKYSNVTHVEAIHEEHSDGTVTIVSSSLRDGGVRSKRVTLTKDNWVIVDMPLWDVNKSKKFFAETVGDKYDIRGALATVLPGIRQDSSRWYCNEWVCYPFLEDSGIFGPNHIAAIVNSK